MRGQKFFFIGVTKCDTIALSKYLHAHPNIFMSTLKEPYYFVEDFPQHRTVSSREDYLALFNKASKRHIALGEASVPRINRNKVFVFRSVAWFINRPPQVFN